MTQEWNNIGEYPPPVDTRICLYFEEFGQLYGTWTGVEFEIENTFAPYDGPEKEPTHWQPVIKPFNPGAPQ